jgi:hypothetical protein
MIISDRVTAAGVKAGCVAGGARDSQGNHDAHREYAGWGIAGGVVSAASIASM